VGTVRVGQASVVIAKGKTQRIGGSLLDFMGTVIEREPYFVVSITSKGSRFKMLRCTGS
jgi:hypothetical protein